MKLRYTNEKKKNFESQLSQSHLQSPHCDFSNFGSHLQVNAIVKCSNTKKDESQLGVTQPPPRGLKHQVNNLEIPGLTPSNNIWYELSGLPCQLDCELDRLPHESDEVRELTSPGIEIDLKKKL